LREPQLAAPITVHNVDVEKTNSPPHAEDVLLRVKPEPFVACASVLSSEGRPRRHSAAVEPPLPLTNTVTKAPSKHDRLRQLPATRACSGRAAEGQQTLQIESGQSCTNQLGWLAGPHELGDCASLVANGRTCGTSLSRRRSRVRVSSLPSFSSRFQAIEKAGEHPGLLSGQIRSDPTSRRLHRRRLLAVVVGGPCVVRVA
jgi:hypothetical protein